MWHFVWRHCWALTWSWRCFAQRCPASSHHAPLLRALRRWLAFAAMCALCQTVPHRQAHQIRTRYARAWLPSACTPCWRSSVHPPTTPRTQDATPCTLHIAVLQSLATHDPVRASIAAVFAVLHDVDAGLLDPTQERLLAFAREAAQGNAALVQWMDSLFRPVLELPNGCLTTHLQASSGKLTASPGTYSFDHGLTVMHWVHRQGGPYKVDAGAPAPLLRHCVVQVSPGNPALAAELRSQVEAGAAAAAVEAADALYRDGAPSWLLEAALLQAAAAAEDGAVPSWGAQSWVRGRCMPANSDGCGSVQHEQCCSMSMLPSCQEWALRVDSPLQCARLVKQCVQLWPLDVAVQTVDQAMHRLDDDETLLADSEDAAGRPATGVKVHDGNTCTPTVLRIELQALRQQLDVVGCVLEGPAASEFTYDAWSTLVNIGQRWSTMVNMYHTGAGQRCMVCTRTTLPSLSSACSTLAAPTQQLRWCARPRCADRSPTRPWRRYVRHSQLRPWHEEVRVHVLQMRLCVYIVCMPRVSVNLHAVQPAVADAGGLGRVLQYLQGLDVEDRAGATLLLLQSLPSMQHRQVRVKPAVNACDVAPAVAGAVVAAHGARVARGHGRAGGQRGAGHAGAGTAAHPVAAAMCALGCPAPAAPRIAGHESASVGAVALVMYHAVNARSTHGQPHRWYLLC